MNRRDFLRRLGIGAAAASVAAPLAVREWPFRVFSFPSKIVIPTVPIALPPEVRVRFIRAFDPAQAKMISRWDVLYGFANLADIPRAPYFMNPDQSARFSQKFELSTPEEAVRLGILSAHDMKAIEASSRRMGQSADMGAEDFETTAIVHPQKFIEKYDVDCELSDEIKDPWET